MDNKLVILMDVLQAEGVEFKTTKVGLRPASKYTYGDAYCMGASIEGHSNDGFYIGSSSGSTSYFPVSSYASIQDCAQDCVRTLKGHLGFQL